MLKFNILLNVILVLAFIIHITFIGYNIKYPDIPSVRVFSKHLRNVQDFPLSFKLCAEEQTNMQELYRKFGYDSIYAFYQGRQRLNRGTWFGWAGHGNGNETLGTVLGKKVIFKFSFPDQFLHTKLVQIFWSIIFLDWGMGTACSCFKLHIL